MNKWLAKLIEETEANLDALHRVAALTKVRHTTNGHRNAHAIARALQLDESRRQEQQPQKKPKRASGTYSKSVRQRRQKSAELLQWIAKHKGEPFRGNLQGLGALMRRGYAKRHGDGYERTDKPFSIEKP